MVDYNLEEKLYLIPKGVNGLQLHELAKIKECMVSHEKVTGILLKKEQVKQLLIDYSELISINDCSFYTQEEREDCVNRFLNGDL